MKTIGMIAGMSWQSSLEYYRILNEEAARRLGGVHSAKIVMLSVDFAEMELLQREGRWEEATRRMVEAAQAVERGGADFLLICTNTMHKMADEVQTGISIPLLHIADAAAARIQTLGLHTVGLLGTRFTMEGGFYVERIRQRFGMQVLTPPEDERSVVHRVIYEELVKGVILPESRAAYRGILSGLVDNGAQGVILGCTEIGLLVKEGDSAVPLFDTTRIHAEAAMDLALQ